MPPEPSTPAREVELKRKLNRLKEEQLQNFNALRVGEVADAEFELGRMRRARTAAYY